MAKPELVCAHCNGKGGRSYPTRTGGKFPNYAWEWCRCCGGKGKTGTEHDVPKKEEPKIDPIEQFLADGGIWD